MATHALMRIGWEPSYVIGGELRTTGVNAGWGTGDWLVVEADESDRSFLQLSPEIAVVTNIELDHHTTYASHVELEQAFARYLRNSLRVVVADARRRRRSSIAPRSSTRRSSVRRTSCSRRVARAFSWAGVEVALAVPGAHNVANAAAALTACVIAGR